jgi:hypothetical protein
LNLRRQDMLRLDPCMKRRVPSSLNEPGDQVGERQLARDRVLAGAVRLLDRALLPDGAARARPRRTRRTGSQP